MFDQEDNKNWFASTLNHSIFVPSAVLILVAVIALFHYWRASQAEPLTQSETALFTISELSLSIWASASISKYLAYQDALRQSARSNRLFGQAAIRRVEAVVDNLKDLNTILESRKGSIVGSENLSHELVTEYLDHVSSMVNSAKISAYSAIEDWIDFSDISRESASSYKELLKNIADIESQLEQKNQELESVSDDESEKISQLQAELQRLDQEKSRMQKELRYSVKLPEPNPSALAALAKAFNPPSLDEKSSQLAHKVLVSSENDSRNSVD